MPQDKLTIEQLATAIKQREPRLASVSNEELVRKVLERRPELAGRLETTQARPPLSRGTDMRESLQSESKEFQGEAQKEMNQAFGPESQGKGIVSRLGHRLKSLAPETAALMEKLVAGGMDWKNALIMASGAVDPAIPGAYFGAQGASQLLGLEPGVEKGNTSPENVQNALLAGSMVAGGPAASKSSVAGRGAELAGKVAGKTGDVAQASVRIPLQRLSGAGKEPVLMEELRRKGKIEERAAAYDKTKAEIEKSNQEKLAEHAEDVQHARQKWVRKSMEVKRAEQEAAKVDAQEQTLKRSQSEYGERLRNNLQQTYQTVKSRLDSRWHGLRTTQINRAGKLSILSDEPLNSKAIADTVDQAERKFLQGAPESIKQFRDLMNWMRAEGPAAVEGEAGGLSPRLRPITWDEARTHYSALGDRMFSGDLPGNVRNAIRMVRDKGLGEELRAGAARANALPQYESLLQDWGQFENDWKDMSSITRGGGSPLAVALKAPNAATLMPQVTGKTGDLLLQRLGKYRDAGASPATAVAIRKLGGEISNLPKVSIPKAPGPFEAPPVPKLREARTPESVPPIDPVAVRRLKMLQYTARPKSVYDFVPPRLFTEPLLSIEAIREWVARQPRKELTLPEEKP